MLTRLKLPPIEDPTRYWRGVTPDGLPVLRLALFADCAWREMEGSHGPDHGPGWPRVAGETLVAQHGVGLETSVVTVAGVGQLPGTEADLVHYLRLTGPPDVLLLQTGAAHYTRGCSRARSSGIATATAARASSAATRSRSSA